MSQPHTNYSTIKDAEEEPDHDRLDQVLINSDSSSQLLTKHEHKFSFKAIKGLLFVLVSAIAYGIATLATSYLYSIDHEISPLDSVVIISLFMIMLSYIYVRYQGINLLDVPLNDRKPLFLRCVSSAAGTITFQIALKLLPLSKAVTLSCTIPLFTMIIAYIVLKESSSSYDIIGCNFAFFGVILVVQPGFLGFSKHIQDEKAENNSYIEIGGLTAVLVSSLCSALSNVFSRSLKDSNAIFQLFYTNLIHLILALVMSFIYHLITMSVPIIYLRSVLVLFVNGALMTACVWFKVRGFALEKAGRGAAAIKYLQVVIGVLGDFIVFGNVPNVWEFIGSALIIGFQFILYVLKALNLIE